MSDDYIEDYDDEREYDMEETKDRRGAQDIALERARQITEEGYSDNHDNAATRCQLALAAMCYVQIASSSARNQAEGMPPPKYWPWDEQYWKPRDPRRTLVMAGALIAAEIDRLDRLEAHKQSLAR